MIGTARSPEFRRARGPAHGGAPPRRARHRPARRDRRRRQPLRRRTFCAQEWPSLVEELVAEGAVDQETADRHPALMIAGLVGSIDNDMLGTDHDRSARTPRCTGSSRRLDAINSHRAEPPAHLRGRGDGPQLRLPGPDERARRQRGLRADPGMAPGPGLGGPPVQGPQGRAGRRAAQQHRDRRGGRARRGQQADHQRLRAPAARGTARRGHPGDHPRARAARRNPQRVRPVHELDGGAHRGPRGARRDGGQHAAAGGDAGQPGRHGTVDGVRHPHPRTGEPDRRQGLQHGPDDAGRQLHGNDQRLPLRLLRAAQPPAPGPPVPDRRGQRRRARAGDERRCRGGGAARAGPRADDARDPRGPARADRGRRAGVAVGRRRRLDRHGRRGARDQPAHPDRPRLLRHRPRPGAAPDRRSADHRRLGRLRGGAHAQA